MDRRGKVFPAARLVLLVLILSGLIVSPALGQQPERVKVLIGFDRQPGAAEQALVHRFGGTIKYTYHLVPAIAATVPEPAIAGLRANPNVTHVELDGEVHATDEVVPWGVDRIGAITVHGDNTGYGVKVAVIDSGIDYLHPDLNDNYAGGWDFVNNDDDPMDDYGHGTHVAGTIAAEYNNEEGVVGVAPEAELYALKVLGANGSGLYSDIIAAIEWAVGNHMQVTNNSYGSSGDPGEFVKEAFDDADAAGVLNVCSAGNTGNPPARGDNVGFPARYESCIAVAATDDSDVRAKWSSTGPDVELAAPGVGINSTLWGGGYGEKSGTSMASPHVAGTAALIIAAGVTDNNVEVRQLLIDTADDLGVAGFDTLYGFGLVDADEAAGLPTGNLAPVANAGLDQSVKTGFPVDLDGSKSADPNGDAITYLWVIETMPAGSYATLSGANTAAPTFIADLDGNYEVELTVMDVGGLSDSDSVVVTAAAATELAMHIDDIEMSLKKAGINYSAVAEVTILDSSDSPVAGATVYGTWSVATSDTDSGLTGADGTVLLASDKVKYAPSGRTFVFTVDDVVLSGWTYDSEANEVETSDSISIQ